MKFAVTGGIGSGKSSVAARLATHGAVVVDADAIAREVVEPGTPGLAAVVAEFGEGILLPDGSLDRAAMAAIVFTDEERRHALEAIVHPLVVARSQELIESTPDDGVTVYDVPLLTELIAQARAMAGGPFPGERQYDAIIVVEAPVEERIARLVARGLDAHDARARIAAQASDTQRREIADHIINNDGTLEQLEEIVDALWAELSVH
jgi:dephospho-CoA kinase